MAEEECKQEECPDGVPDWMLTYSDMVTLLLCFFVLLLSMSSTDAKKFEMAASSFQNALSGVMESLPTVAIHQEVLKPKLGGDDQNKKIAADVAKRVKDIVKKSEKLKEAVTVQVTDNGIAIRISDPVGFGVGSDQLQPEFEKALMDILGVIRDMPDRDIRVEGHTDDIPMKSPRFPTNWELSAARALTVVKLFYQNGENPAKLSAVGYGEFRPMVENTDDESRRKNRRIEIFVEYLQKVENTPEGK